jgi:hypothetical protein
MASRSRKRFSVIRRVAVATRGNVEATPGGESASLRSRCSAIDGWRREGDPSVVDQRFTCPWSLRGATAGQRERVARDRVRDRRPPPS